jgi:hypothetical protein
VAVWDELKVVLARVRDQQPGALTQFPQLDVDPGPPPFTIRLAAWAAATAEELHRQFGDDVELTVGALPFPPGRLPPPGPDPGPLAELLNPDEVTAELDGPAVVSSGHSLQHGLLLGNHTGRELHIATNGQVTAIVVDPQSGEIVGGFAGPQALPLVIFRIPPGQTERVPLLVGTASFTARLGYAIPPGQWGIQATLTFGRPPGDSVRRRSPVLPLTVEAADYPGLKVLP